METLSPVRAAVLVKSHDGRWLIHHPQRARIVLQVTVDQLPWLLIGAVTGIGSTLLLRGWVFAERPEQTLTRLVRAFRARLHALVEAVADLLVAPPEGVENTLRAVRRRRTQLNETALLVAERLEQRESEQRADGPDQDGDDLALRILDAELAAERLAVTTRRLVECGTPVEDGSRRALLAGLRGLGTASITGIPPGVMSTLLERAKRSVSTLVAETDGYDEDRAQRVAFAVTRLADAMGTAPHPEQPTRPDPGNRPERPRSGRGYGCRRSAEPAPGRPSRSASRPAWRSSRASSWRPRAGTGR